MATSISNPASFSSIRSAFTAEGYGSSTSFYAYRQGGGIVPSTSAFDAIGAGTSGDPLRLSQFSGFTVPSPYLELQTMSADQNDAYIYVPAPVDDYQTILRHGWNYTGLGSMSPVTSSIYSGASWQEIYWLSDSMYGPLGQIFFTVYRPVAYGAISNSGWSNVQIVSNVAGTTNISRTSMGFSSYSNGTYQYGQWSTPQYTVTPDPFLNGAYLGGGAGASVTVTFT